MVKNSPFFILQNQVVGILQVFLFSSMLASSSCSNRDHNGNLLSFLLQGVTNFLCHELLWCRNTLDTFLLDCASVQRHWQCCHACILFPLECNYCSQQLIPKNSLGMLMESGLSNCHCWFHKWVTAQTVNVCRFTVQMQPLCAIYSGTSTFPRLPCKLKKGRGNVALEFTVAFNRYLKAVAFFHPRLMW